MPLIQWNIIGAREDHQRTSNPAAHVWPADEQTCVDQLQLHGSEIRRIYISRADHHIVLELIYVKLDDCNCTIEDNYSQILTKTWTIPSFHQWMGYSLNNFAISQFLNECLGITTESEIPLVFGRTEPGSHWECCYRIEPTLMIRAYVLHRLSEILLMECNTLTGNSTIRTRQIHWSEQTCMVNLWGMRL